MNTRKILLLIVLPVVVIGLAVGAYLWWTHPQVLMLADGTKLTFLGVTYGKKHVSPVPRGAAKSVRSQRINGTDDMMYVWFYQEKKGNNWPNYETYAYDSANTACVSGQRFYGNGNGRNGIVGVGFAAFPRHERKLILRMAEWGRNGQQDVKGQIVVRNPDRRGTSSVLRPPALPDKQSDGDLDVTLTRIELKPNAFLRGNPGTTKTDEPRNRGVLTAFHIEQGGETMTNWQAVQVTTSDGSGNSVRNNSSSNQRDGLEPTFVYQWGLWPDEPAWKLRVEFSRTSGFNADELWTVNEIPVEKGSANNIWQNDPKAKAIVEGEFAGSKVKLLSVKKLPADQVQGWGMDADLQIIAAPDFDGARLTVLKLTDEKGQDIPFNNSGWGGGQYHFGLRELGAAKSVNATIAIHRSRFVEFTVKPPKKSP